MKVEDDKAQQTLKMNMRTEPFEKYLQNINLINSSPLDAYSF